MRRWLIGIPGFLFCLLSPFTSIAQSPTQTDANSRFISPGTTGKPPYLQEKAPKTIVIKVKEEYELLPYHNSLL